ncbi:hypothetical protein C2E21_3136 [Chlorella sorokiniana]|uniref:Uncharacterized protein n=1 Tax=Chlorella sorokiniana TaxID=3076 RepID=A0A2P6TWL2_CHLSO|nr:hypothetical protein C2E21_3136 [Chlorella sorokiniana]|eukprot:PRW58444.1 hypothetical protein C2E21_3136 [Chlorella sorokiniana]
MWGHTSTWATGEWVGGAGQGPAAEGEAGPTAPAPLAGVAADALAGIAAQGASPLLHPASSVPAPATVWVPDSPAAAATLGAFPPRPAQPATSAPLPTWLPPSPFSSAAFDSGGGGGTLPTLHPTASAPLPSLSPFSSGGFEGGVLSDAAHALQPGTLGPLQPALRGLSSGGFESVTSPIQLAAQPAAADPPALQPQQPAGMLIDALAEVGGGMHQPMPDLLLEPPSPRLATTSKGFVDDEDPLLRYLLEDDAFAAESPLQPVPADPPAPRPLSPAACLVRMVPAVLGTSRRLLEALLAHGADPLEQDPTTSRQPTTFLSECLHPTLLRLAVTHVQRQCQIKPDGGGRRLTTGCSLSSEHASF